MPAIRPPTLHDGDLTLRPMRPDDADAVTAACQDEAIRRWVGVPSPYGREHAMEWLAACERRAQAGEAVNLLGFLGRDRLVASISLLELDGLPGRGEIGYWVAADARGLGVATRSVRLVEDWARSELGLTRIEILVHRDNGPSRRVAERAGYADTGERRLTPRREDCGPPMFVVYVREA